MSKLKIRRTSLLSILILVIAIIGFKFLSDLKEGPKKDVAKAKIIKVDVIEIINQDITADISINGRLNSKYKIDIFTEVTGRLLPSKKSFKEGVKFKKGEVLLKLDDSNYRLNLIATRSSFHSLLTQLLAEVKIEYPDNFSKWEQYINQFDPETNVDILPKVNNNKEKNYLVSKNVYTQYYNIKAQEAQLDKYTILAPFDGIVDQANINPNSVVRAGQKLAEFINPSIFELEVGVSLIEISKIEIGDKVTLTSNDIPGEWEGKISRIGESLNEQTMSFKVYIEVVSNQLYEGMYLKGILNSFMVNHIAKIPTNLIRNDNFVYVVQDTVLHFQKVEIIHEADGYTLVKGLEDHTQMINHNISNAYEGMVITLD